jgi:hypothetical protein
VSLQPFIALDSREFHFLSFFEGTVTTDVDLGVMDKILLAVFGGNESISLRGVKPLDSALLTLCHTAVLLFSHVKWVWQSDDLLSVAPPENNFCH